MNPGIWLIVGVLVFGSAIVWYGWWADRQRHARRVHELSTVPGRPIPHLPDDAEPPSYISGEDALRRPADAPSTDLSSDARDALAADLDNRDATYVPGGYPDKRFATDAPSGYAVLDEPGVLVCLDDVTTVRELLSTLDRTKRAGEALVVVAPRFDAEVVRTVLANDLHGTLKALLVEALPTPELIAATDATPTEHADRQADYVPAKHLGRCRRWVSDADDSWIIG